MLLSKTQYNVWDLCTAGVKSQKDFLLGWSLFSGYYSGFHIGKQLSKEAIATSSLQNEPWAGKKLGELISQAYFG